MAITTTAPTALAVQHSAETTDKSIGVHGMVLLAVGDQLIASHMPLHGNRHGRQLLMRVQIDNQADLQRVTDLLRKHSLVTLKPERFSLHHLHQGTLTGFNTSVYSGHFERGGQLETEGVRMRVLQRLLDIPLDAQQPGLFHPLQIGGAILLLHHIGEKPSFDQIVLVQTRNIPTSVIDSGSRTPLSTQTWPRQWSAAGLEYERTLYLETADFAQP